MLALNQNSWLLIKRLGFKSSVLAFLNFVPRQSDYTMNIIEMLQISCLCM